MYSAVLMLALTAGSETADFGRNRGHGCTTSCSAVVRTSCSRVATCASSCHSRGKLFGNRGHGCSASHGCTTTVVAHSCARSHGCSASCHSRHSRRGCHSRGHGCSVSYGCTTSVGCTGGVIVVPEKKKMPKTGEPIPPPKDEKKKTPISAPATIVVSLPADARLTVDGAPTNSGSDRRTLFTPELEFGATYVYTMRAEVIRDGRTQVQTQDVTVRGGETSAVQFQFSNQAVASR
jgi:uncharacterized protein (TIGR03000 family)